MNGTSGLVPIRRRRRNVERDDVGALRRQTFHYAAADVAAAADDHDFHGMTSIGLLLVLYDGAGYRRNRGIHCL